MSQVRIIKNPLFYWAFCVQSCFSRQRWRIPLRMPTHMQARQPSRSFSYSPCWTSCLMLLSERIARDRRARIAGLCRTTLQFTLDTRNYNTVIVHKSNRRSPARGNFMLCQGGSNHFLLSLSRARTPKTLDFQGFPACRAFRIRGTEAKFRP